MTTIFDDAARAELVARLARLTPEASPRWGGLDAPRVLVHLADSVRAALGEVESTVGTGPTSWPGLRWLAMNIPLPRGVTGPPEAFRTPPGDFEDDRRELVGLLEKLVVHECEQWPGHVVFGPMTRDDWGCFTHKHLDHHLRQFGV
ncbi:MAG: DUF1569 domain-containing protein [Acidobacteriota bacterium]